MARIKWNVNPNVNTNMNNVQKTPPDCLKNFMPQGGAMRQPFNTTLADQLAVLNNQPPSSDLDVSSVQPGQSSREGNFNYTSPPGMAGEPLACWPQTLTNTGAIKGNRSIQSNLSDLPSKFNRKYTSQK